MEDTLKLHEKIKAQLMDDLGRDIAEAWDAPESGRTTHRILDDKKSQHGI